MNGTLERVRISGVDYKTSISDRFTVVKLRSSLYLYRCKRLQKEDPCLTSRETRSAAACVGCRIGGVPVVLGEIDAARVKPNQSGQDDYPVHKFGSHLAGQQRWSPTSGGGGGGG